MVNQTKQRKLRRSTSKKTKTRTRKNTKRMSMRTNKMRGGAHSKLTQTGLYFKGMFMIKGRNYKLFYNNEYNKEYYVVGNIKFIENNKITFQYNNANNTINLDNAGYPHKILFEFNVISENYTNEIEYTAEGPVTPMPVTPTRVEKPKVAINPVWFYLPENLEENKDTFMSSISGNDLQKQEQATLLFNRFPGCKTLDEANQADTALKNVLSANDTNYDTKITKYITGVDTDIDKERSTYGSQTPAYWNDYTLHPTWLGWIWQCEKKTYDPKYGYPNTKRKI